MGALSFWTHLVWAFCIAAAYAGYVTLMASQNPFEPYGYFIGLISLIAGTGGFLWTLIWAFRNTFSISR